jgi:hypothetical protein
LKVIKDLTIEVPGTNAHYLNLDLYQDDDDSKVLFYGYVFLEDLTKRLLIKTEAEKTYLNLTMPTEFCQTQKIGRDFIFDRVYGICPYTCEWLNDLELNNRFRFIFYPFNENDIPPKTKKLYDVIYHGGIHMQEHIDMIKHIKNLNYRYLTQTFCINGETENHIPFATDLDLTNEEKILKIAQSKISIAFNYFPVRHKNDAFNIKAKPNWNKNEAFKHIDDLKIIPQFKSRVNEAAFSRTLNLVKRDPWNVIERFYEKDEFIYFDDVDELPELILKISENYSDYEPMIEKAFKKSLN